MASTLSSPRAASLSVCPPPPPEGPSSASSSCVISAAIALGTSAEMKRSACSIDSSRSSTWRRLSKTEPPAPPPPAPPSTTPPPSAASPAAAPSPTPPAATATAAASSYRAPISVRRASAAPAAADRRLCMKEVPGMRSCRGTEMMPCQWVRVSSVKWATATSSSTSTPRHSESDARVAASFSASYRSRGLSQHATRFVKKTSTSATTAAMRRSNWPAATASGPITSCRTPANRWCVGPSLSSTFSPKIPSMNWLYPCEREKAPAEEPPSTSAATA
mmetsp:Transcript_29695/g.88849  ORF Transcript_29695/g.88849 Transcript_29695/m.88849 type:complete len:276 (-) Transcript_29695:443-1270(-)